MKQSEERNEKCVSDQVTSESHRGSACWIMQRLPETFYRAIPKARKLGVYPPVSCPSATGTSSLVSDRLPTLLSPGRAWDRAAGVL